MKNLEKIVEDTAVELLKRAANILQNEYIAALSEARQKTKGEIGRSELSNILKNIELAKETCQPICQDTGVVAFMLKLGDGFPIRSKLREILENATRRATKEIPLRPNAVDLFRGNTKDNVGPHVPLVYIELVEGDDLEITALPKGGGSSNIASHSMVTPGLGWKGVKQFVLESTAKAGSLGCPPYFIGVGVGGGEDYCMFLAKKALLKPFKVRSEDPKIAEIEEELLEKINSLGIGVMGLGEGPTALDLHIEIAARHPASLPVGVVFSCWAFRHAKGRVSKEGDITFEYT